MLVCLVFLKKKKVNSINSSIKNITPNRPEPIIGKIDVIPYRKKMNPQIAINSLLKGQFVLVFDEYSTGLFVLKKLKIYLESKFTQNTFDQQREYRTEYRRLSNLLLLSVRDHKLKVKKSPEIGWFELLYSDFNEFFLPFPKVQGLNSAWQWYKKGVNIPVLSSKLHPFYDTYFPTRFEHLWLFDNWLKESSITKQTAFDIGVGSGVLTFQLLKHGFSKVIATDTNPNAIVGMNTKYKSPKIELHYGNLFANCDDLVDLIVFNPPWIPATYDLKGIDKAIYYENTLFDDFFKQAFLRLKPNGRLVLLFSNLAKITNVTEKNPIEEELKNNSRFQKDILLTDSVVKASTQTRRNQNWRDKELVELWVLKKRLY